MREILPNLVAPLIVYSSLLIPANILLEAALSFLGVGVEAGTASWGAMISEATTLFPDAWWFMLFPGLALLFPSSPSTWSATASRTPSTRAAGERSSPSQLERTHRRKDIHP